MIVVVMGVSGSGKTTVGQQLASRLGCTFFDADDFHSQANIDKMSHGVPLTDDDRESWLDSLARVLRDCVEKKQSAVLACSALKQKYRDRLRVSDDFQFVYLRGSYEQILSRMQQRQHFMKPEMLASQFAALEEPKDAIVVDVALAPEVIVENVMRSLI
jgi:gluconokinase